MYSRVNHGNYIHLYSTEDEGREEESRGAARKWITRSYTTGNYRLKWIGKAFSDSRKANLSPVSMSMQEVAKKKKK